MKILLIATVQSHICQFHRPLAEMLHAHGCEVHAAARDNLAEKNGLTLDFAERVFDIPFDRSPCSAKNAEAYRRLKALLDAGRYDVIHCNTPVGGVLGRLAARGARRKGTRVFYTAHGFHFYQGAPKKNWAVYYPIEKAMCRYTDKLITITDEDDRLAKAHFRVPVERIHGVGANSRKYVRLPRQAQAELRQALGYQPQERLLLCTGELLPNKNQITAIRAMERVAAREPRAKLLLAGNGPALPELQAAVQARGLAGHVEFLGYRTDLERFANAAEVIVSCSFREGLPMNIVEGMLAGKPVVASLNRGHRELVVPGETGYLAPPTEPEAFAERILALLTDPALAQKMGDAGYRRAQSYTDVSVQGELARIYGLDQSKGGG